MRLQLKIPNRPIRVACLGESEIPQREMEAERRLHQPTDDAKGLQIQTLTREDTEALDRVASTQA